MQSAMKVKKLKLVFVWMLCCALSSPCLVAGVEISGCDAPLPAQTVNPETDFANFTKLNVGQTKDAGEDVPYFYLQTGNKAIDPNNIILEFDQEVCVNFFYEDAGYQSTLGWLRLDEAVMNDDGSLNWSQTPRHILFENVNDQKNAVGTNVTGGDGVLDAYANYTHDELKTAGFDPVVEAVNPVIDIKDMRKCLKDASGAKMRFSAGSELVFWLDNGVGNVYFTKNDWNADVFNVCYNATAGQVHERTYQLGSPNTGTNNCVTTTKGFLDQRAIDRLNTEFGLTMSGDYKMSVTQGEKFDHVIVAAPSDALDQWILSWEDLPGSNTGGDMDYNDMTFRIQRQTGGTIQTSSDQAIKPVNADGSANPNGYFSFATFKVYEETPTAAECAGETSIRYRVSANNGASWYPSASAWISADDWTITKSFSIVAGEKVVGGATIPPSSTGKVYREIGINFEALNIMGQELIWHAEMHSDVEICVPKIYGVELSGQSKSNATISNTSPMPLGNLVYSMSLETPFYDWQEKRLRGHVRAAVLYNPSTAVIYNSAIGLWDSGEVVSNQSSDLTSTDHRKIYYPIQVLSADLSSEVQSDLLVSPAGVTLGDGVNFTYSGILPYVPVVSSTIKISAETSSGIETFEDSGNIDLNSAQGGGGSINRFTGEFTVTFSSEPLLNTPIKAQYSYYTTSINPIEFTSTNVNNELLALDSTDIHHDFNGDSVVNEADGDWLVNWVRGYYNSESNPKVEKDWKLGAIDHSNPAVLTSPGFPSWYYGSDIHSEEKQSYLNYVHQLAPPTDVASSQAAEDVWLSLNTERKTVLFVGSRDGMLHAFDAGKFRPNGDYWRTGINEKRGYFVWEDPDGAGSEPVQPNYGTGKELWSFIPANLVASLKNNYLEDGDQSMVDASPTISDVRIGNKLGVHGGWKSVLLSAEGNGGNSVFCLDVTDPESPKFLWEFSDPDLFRSRSSPSVGPIGKVMVDGQPLWAAFFVSGNSNPQAYPSIYVVNIADGSLIDRIFLYAPSSDNQSRSTDANGNEVCPGMDARYTDTAIPCGLGGIPTSEPVIIDIDGNGYIDRMYVGTYVPNLNPLLPPKGALFRVNLSDDPNEYWTAVSNVIVNTDYTDDDKFDVNGVPLAVGSADRWQPIYASPTVDVERSYDEDGTQRYDVRLMFGTGDSPFVQTDDSAYTNYYIYSYIDHSPKALSSPELSQDPDQIELEWFMALPEGHRVTTSAFASARKLYIGTSTSGVEDPCVSGENAGRLYVLDYDGSNVDNPDFIETGNMNSAPVVEDEHVYIKTTKGTKILGKGTFQNETSSGGPGKSTPTTWRELTD